MSKKKEMTFLSADGSTTIYGSVWEPEALPFRGIVQICHGMTEYVDRYQWLADQFCAKGFVVCGDDHLGHGRTATAETKLGYFGERNGDRYLIEDEDRMRKQVSACYPDLPYFLLGHSMGSFITRNYVAQYGEGLAGYVCCGTSGPNPAVNMGLLLANLFVAAGGGRRKAKFLDRLAFGSYNKRIPNAVVGFEWLSRDEDTYLAYAADPKAGFLFTNAGFRDLFRLLKHASGRQWSKRLPPNLPILFCAGAEDPVGQYGKGVRKVYELVKSSGSTDVELCLYPGARHELQNELNREEFAEDVLNWMTARLPEHRSGQTEIL